MLSYRHAFHAGNHADMIKHFILFLTLDYFNQKDKPYWYIDTHSGAGLYDLSGSEAQKVGEYKQGIALLEQANKLPAELAEFVGRLKNLVALPSMILIFQVVHYIKNFNFKGLFENGHSN